MIGLAPLLTALREAGLPVGIAEMARLQRVFALSPEPCGLRLESVLRAILVKSSEDCVVFDRVFETWLRQADHEVRLREEEPEPVAGGLFRAPRSRIRRPLWRLLAPVVLLLLSLPIGERSGKIRAREAGPSNPQRQDKPLSPLPPSTATALTPAEISNRRFPAWVPILTASPAEPLWQGWLPLGLGVAALALAETLWLALRRRNWQPEPASEPVQKGPPRVFLSPPGPTGLQLLLPREEEALVWGIGHFVAEEPTRRLDLHATVRATARAAGLPHLRFHLARHPREVWLWIDEAADDPAIPRLADEVAAALAAHGLPVERALFRGVPDWLVHAEGKIFAPNEVDERRDTALVAILTDGRVLALRYAADDRRMGLDALLRSLSFWPRLAFVDFSPEPGLLGAILAPQFLTRIIPQELAGFLGAGDVLRRRAVAEADDVAVWAAACALAPSSVDEERAFQLRQRLGLTASPWAIRALNAEAPGPAGRLGWPAPVRARRINWLRAAEAQTENGLDPESFLGQALRFWEEVYDRELQERTAGEAGKLWQATPAHQHLRMERALLAVWNERDASGAIRELYSLHGGALRETIEEHLGRLAPRDWGDPHDLHLPWRWEGRTGPEQVMLLEMHLGGGMPAATLRRPGRLWLGLALCLGLAAGALTAAVLSGSRRPVGPPLLVHHPGRPAEALEGVQQLSDGLWGVAVATYKTLAFQRVPPAARVKVQWEKRVLPCVARRDDGKAEIWSCGSVASPPRLSEAGGRRVIALATTPRARGARALAVDLLDSGSADVVLISHDWQKFVSYFIHSSLEAQELLSLPDSEWRGLSASLRFDGTKPLRDVWPGVYPLFGDRSVLLQGLRTCRNGETVTDQGMVFVRICPGTFMMGSSEDDRWAEKNEKPAHEVTLSEYWIGQNEVTEWQYWQRGSKVLQPARERSWSEAKRFCERHGWRLPTEAEWEYAARAGSQTTWFFGTDSSFLGNFAWYRDNSGQTPRPVGTKNPNSWGLYDVYGNVWEWVADWYGPYTIGRQMDPIGPGTGTSRVMRGGAYDYSPARLRSADRAWFQPTFRAKNLGFRCARNLGHQR